MKEKVYVICAQMGNSENCGREEVDRTTSLEEAVEAARYGARVYEEMIEQHKFVLTVFDENGNITSFDVFNSYDQANLCGLERTTELSVDGSEWDYTIHAMTDEISKLVELAYTCSMDEHLAKIQDYPEYYPKPEDVAICSHNQDDKCDDLPF